MFLGRDWPYNLKTIGFTAREALERAGKREKPRGLQRSEY